MFSGAIHYSYIRNVSAETAFEAQVKREVREKSVVTDIRSQPVVAGLVLRLSRDHGENPRHWRDVNKKIPGGDLYGSGGFYRQASDIRKSYDEGAIVTELCPRAGI